MMEDDDGVSNKVLTHSMSSNSTNFLTMRRW